jgi:hypothetical protein
MMIKEVLLSQAAKAQRLAPQKLASLKKWTGGPMGPVMSQDMETPAAEMDHEEALEAGFRAAWAAIFDDDSMDSKAKLSRAKDILSMRDKLGDGDDDDGLGSGEVDNAVHDHPMGAEAHKPAPSTNPAVKLLREELAVRDLVNDAKLIFPRNETRKAFIASLVRLSESQRKVLIAERQALQSVNTPTFKSNQDRMKFLRSGARRP